VAPTRRPLAHADPALHNPVVDFERLPVDAPGWAVDAVLCALGSPIKQCLCSGGAVAAASSWQVISFLSGCGENRRSATILRGVLQRLPHTLFSQIHSFALR